MNIIFNIFNRKNKYPKEIRLALKAKYKSLHRHKRNIKNILKRSEHKKFLWFTLDYMISPKDQVRIKHHKYMIRKINKEIHNIEWFYET